MLSRVAESIYWMMRYIERAENMARLIDVNLTLTLDLPEETESQWRAVVTTTGDIIAFDAVYPKVTSDAVIEFLVFDEENPNSVYRCLRAARENARSVREVISSEVWEQINQFYLMITNTRYRSALDAPSEFFQQVRLSSHLIEGVINATMSHGESWHFARLGRLLERGEQTARLLDTKYFLLLPSPEYVGSTVDDIQWSAVLRSASAFEMYRKRHGRVEPHRVVEFLLLNRLFPRSTHYCVIQADESLHQISGAPVGSFHNAGERELGRLRGEFAFSEASDIIKGGLHEYLDLLQTKFSRVGMGIQETFFGLRPAATDDTTTPAADE
ncbi:MAG: alpha-E domain-containing protein [Spirochaetaceae bacterium]|nr:MAG: alpha-E domain-containing protein [Spirochaetaceae bacterium]